LPGVNRSAVFIGSLAMSRRAGE